MPEIRPFRPGDEPALADICLRTADAGADATGVLADDDLWAELFALPYAARHPEYAFVVAGDDDVPLGYVLGVPDTDAFNAWFAAQWWPRFDARWPRPDAGSTQRQDVIVGIGHGRGETPDPYAATHPAHLHIDLLPQLQGQGWGRRLIDTLTDALRRDGVPGVHLVADARNTAAVAFYERLGFTRLPSDDGVVALGITLDDGAPT
ncbi:GNAT family N-acetyltransferase [Microbacterium telephonicum]|uniref:Acetyltransferase (GNAT) family protein n=1 Tax=Microbacterium telephonicum TaxID=1714841 RepID=A0A498CMI8_9MICO|nr:N-acetyltransferase [Microbacterium telephonicum]RLK52918.1 acetyltransferase (GNAT) family protein [Microbacterium telephonicum]